jgi:hypothetical protein
MRWVYIAIVVVFVVVVLIFVGQNTDVVSVKFLGSALSFPLALIVLVVYFLGAATGGTLRAAPPRDPRLTPCTALTQMPRHSAAARSCSAGFPFPIQAPPSACRPIEIANGSALPRCGGEFGAAARAICDRWSVYGDWTRTNM